MATGQIIHINKNVITKSAHLLQITIDVALSKHFPSPELNFDGGHDLTNRLIHLDRFIVLTDFNNCMDLINGSAIILKGPTIKINKSNATVPNSIEAGSGTIDADVISVYSAKLSQAVTLQINMDMMGCLKTELCMSFRIWRILYLVNHEETIPLGFKKFLKKLKI